MLPGFIEEEIARMQPRVICVMGEVAAEVLCGENEPIHRLRRRQHRYKLGSKSVDTIPMQVTYHPRFLLNFQNLKRRPGRICRPLSVSLLAKNNQQGQFGFRLHILPIKLHQGGTEWPFMR